MINFIIGCFVKIRIIRNSRKLLKIGKNAYLGKNGTIVGGKNISIGKSFSVGDEFKLQVWDDSGMSSANSPHIYIGDNVSLMCNCQISCCNKIIIGDGCLFGDNVFITDNFHGRSTASELDTPPVQRELYSKGPVVVGKNVWIGRNACIMPGVTIGDGAVIGANSVVSKDVDAYTVVGGVPTKVIRRINEILHDDGR